MTRREKSSFRPFWFRNGRNGGNGRGDDGGNGLNRGNGNGSRAKSAQRKALFEPIEPRILLSADLVYAADFPAFDLVLRLDETSQMVQILDNDTLTLVAEQALAETGAVIISGSSETDSLTVDILDENTAEARFIATVRASRSGAPPGEDMLEEFCGSDRFVVTFAKEEGDWKVLKAGILRSTAD